MLNISAVSATLLTLIVAVTAILFTKGKKEDGLFEIKLMIKFDIPVAAVCTVLTPMLISLLPNFSWFSESAPSQWVILFLTLALFAYIIIRLFYRMYYTTLREEDGFIFCYNECRSVPPNDVSNMSLKTRSFQVRAFKKKLYRKASKPHKRNKNKLSREALFDTVFETTVDSIFEKWDKDFRDYSNDSIKVSEILKYKFEKQLKPRIQAPDQVVMMCLSWIDQSKKEEEEKTIWKSLMLLDEYICYMLKKKISRLKWILRFNYYCSSNANVYLLYSDLLYILAYKDCLNKDKCIIMAEWGRQSYQHIAENT